jgi:hypothetical protein
MSSCGHGLHEFVRLSGGGSKPLLPLMCLRVLPELPTAAIPNGSWPGITNSYLDFFLPCHSKIAPAGTMQRRVMNDPVQNGVWSISSDRALQRRRSGNLNAQRLISFCRSPFRLRWILGCMHGGRMSSSGSRYNSSRPTLTANIFAIRCFSDLLRTWINLLNHFARFMRHRASYKIRGLLKPIFSCR